MSVCFYDNGGEMAGIDAHEYFTIGPLGVPVPVLFTPHLVGAPNSHAIARFDKRTPTVTAESRLMIQRGFTIHAVPHLPMTFLPPHPAAELANIAKIIVGSSSKAVMGIASVTGEGASLATCLAACVGANANCGPGVGVVVNPSSVVTSPTAADYAGAAAAWIMSLVLGEVKILPSAVTNWFLKKVLGPELDEAVRDFVTDQMG